MKLFRAVSQLEKDDYDQHSEFRTGRNTLEAKQFFKSKVAVLKFVERSVIQNYDPAYAYLYVIDIDEECLSRIEPSFMSLDGYEAVSVQEEDLVDFNNCVNFVNEEAI